MKLFRGIFRHEREEELGIPFHLEPATLDDLRAACNAAGITAEIQAQTLDEAATEWNQAQWFKDGRQVSAALPSAWLFDQAEKRRKKEKPNDADE